jgi:hypothetical protein
MSCPANNGCLRWTKEKRLHGGGVGPEMRSPAELMYRLSAIRCCLSLQSALNGTNNAMY